ncbi:MAG: aldo/keto reductase [Anaerolineae bacterium]|nr:aldo/keto reductase [Anaerolineae bacterium]
MKYRRLGRTDLRVSVVGVGTWQFGGEWGKAFTQAEVDALLARALELGINLIDTAECYGDHLSEQLIGQSIRHNRDQWIVATKFGHRFAGHLERDQLWTAAAVEKQLEDSLKALQTDYIDLYQFHSGTDESFDQPELWEMLGKQVQAGKIRHLGISISSQGEKIHQTRQAPEVGAGAIQVLYNRLARGPEANILPACQELDLGVLARVPLASGYLSGKYKPGATFTNTTDVRAGHKEAEILETLREVEHIQQTEVPPGVDMAQWALAWCLQHPAVTCVIPGCKSVAQVESNAAAADLPLVAMNHPQALA